MAKKQPKIYSFDWDGGGYGRGILLAVATSPEEATEVAKENDSRWVYEGEFTSLKFAGEYKTPHVILDEHYQE